MEIHLRSGKRRGFAPHVDDDRITATGGVAENRQAALCGETTRPAHLR